MYRSGFEIYRSGFEVYTLARDPVLSSIDESRSVRFENQFYRSDFETSGNETSQNETSMNPLLNNDSATLLYVTNVTSKQDQLIRKIYT